MGNPNNLPVETALTSPQEPGPATPQVGLVTPPKKMKLTVKWIDHYMERDKKVEETVFDPFAGFDGAFNSSIAMAIVLETGPDKHHVRLIPHTFVRSFEVTPSEK